MLEPRRIAAISASQRIAEENRWQLGKEVGYQVRFENRSSHATRLLFLTEALLTKRLHRDPSLEDVGIVVLDEFHERSLHVDIALGALVELRELARPDLKIVVMSATLDSTPLAKFLGGAEVVEVPGKIFPLTIRHEDKAQLLRTGPDFIERLRRLVQKAVSENETGDILCFLPGRSEIERLREALEDWAQSLEISINPLHGQLSLDEQKKAILPNGQMRKIILATNVAESSLTVEGVRIVVDSGLARTTQIHPRTGFEALETTRISRASMTQRAGRAARLGPGIVYRAFSLHDERSMREFEQAEVHRSDLAETCLLLSGLGVRDPASFAWFESPPTKLLDDAKHFLDSLGALDANGELTPLGIRIREIPIAPRLAKLLIAGETRGSARFAAELAALLSQSRPLPRGAAESGAESDLLLAWLDWNHARQHPRNRLIAKTVEQLLESMNVDEDSDFDPEDEIPELLLEAYPDRLARRRKVGEPQAKMSGGRGVRIHNDSSVRASEYFLALEVGEGRDASESLVFSAVGLSQDMVEERFGKIAQANVRVEWDESTKRFWAIEAKEWQGLSIGREHRRGASPDEAQDDLTNLCLSRWKDLLAMNKSLGDWWNRVCFLSTRNKDFPLPPESSLHERISLATYGENSFENVVEKNLLPFFTDIFTSAEQARLERECPEAWLVPSGQKHPIDYSSPEGARIEVRLQELFGLSRAPVVAGEALTLVLLAPNYRPVQVTRDLASFWQNAYPEVKKELRARYPKHSWPEDPLTAKAEAKGKRKFFPS